MFTKKYNIFYYFMIRISHAFAYKTAVNDLEHINPAKHLLNERVKDKRTHLNTLH